MESFPRSYFPNVILDIGGVRDIRLTAVGGNFNIDLIRFETAGGNNPNDSTDVAQTLQAEAFASQSGIQAVGGTKVGFINNGDWISFTNLNIVGANTFTANVSSATAGGTIEIRAGSVTGPLLGSVQTGSTGNWNVFQDVTTSIAPVTTPTTIFLVFTGGGGFLFDVNSFVFSASGSGGGGSSGGGALQTVNLAPAADVYVQNTTTVNNNVLRVESGGVVSTTYLRFNVEGVSGSVTGAKLRLDVPAGTAGGSPGTGTVEVFVGSGNASWTEASITSGNAPSQGVLLGSKTETFGLSTTHEIDLTPTQILASGNVTLIVRINNTQNVAFSSKEGSSDPQLIITSQ